MAASSQSILDFHAESSETDLTTTSEEEGRESDDGGRETREEQTTPVVVPSGGEKQQDDGRKLGEVQIKRTISQVLHSLQQNSQTCHTDMVFVEK